MDDVVAVADTQQNVTDAISDEDLSEAADLSWQVGDDFAAFRQLGAS